MSDYLVATIKPWNIAAFQRRADSLPGQWNLIDTKEGLNLQALEKINPRYIFFPHWSWIVPDEILNRFECVCFHMTDVPYGRGGSPLQNLIVRGHKDTKLTALRMTKELDAGPVYLKKPLSLTGTAQEIFENMADLAYDMMEEIIAKDLKPKTQEGNVTEFARRAPAMSALPENASLDALYDHIRMLDADTYPPAFLDHGDFRLEFSDARRIDNEHLEARVILKKRPHS